MMPALASSCTGSRLHHHHKLHRFAAAAIAASTTVRHIVHAPTWRLAQSHPLSAPCYLIPSAHPLAPRTPHPRFMTASPKKKARRSAAAGREPGSDSRLPLRPITVALVGRPNVGKSSLFNMLARRRLAIVDAVAGTTRDWKEAATNIGDLQLTVLDTGGLEDRPGADSMEARMLDLTRSAVQLADAVLFVVDARAGVTPEDERFARWVKRARAGGAGVHLLANKTEGWLGHVEREDAFTALVRDCFVLGLGEPIPVSAAHGDGLEDVYRILEPYARRPLVLLQTTVGMEAAAAAGLSTRRHRGDDAGVAAPAVASVVVGEGLPLLHSHGRIESATVIGLSDHDSDRSSSGSSSSAAGVVNLNADWSSGSDAGVVNLKHNRSGTIDSGDGDGGGAPLTSPCQQLLLTHPCRRTPRRPTFPCQRTQRSDGRCWRVWSAQRAMCASRSWGGRMQGRARS